MTDALRFRPFVCTLIACVLLSVASTAIARDWADKPWLKTPKALPGDGQTLQLRTAYGTRFIAYLNGPEDAGTAVLLIHDRWGINRHVTAWADRLAAEGYRVLAVDLYDRREVRREDMGDFVWRQIDPAWIKANLDAALRFIGQRQDRIVVSAWGKGIGPALELVGRKPDRVDALALYPDPATTRLTDDLPWLPVAVLTHPVDRSPVHLRSDRATARITEEALEATHTFLSAR